MRFLRSFFVLGLASFLFCSFGVTSSITHSESEQISLPIAEWLAQGEHKTFSWKVHVSHPELTFQQRYRVWIAASVDTESLQSRSVQRDLHFFLKAADQNGKWFAGDTYNKFPIKKKFEPPMDIQFEAGLYLQPGSYTVAVVIYDAVLNEHNTSFTRVVVKPPSNDEFPRLLEGLPEVEFLPTPIEGLASPATGHASLEVPTKEPVQFDLIVDLGLQDPAESRQRVPPPLPPMSRDPGRSPGAAPSSFPPPRMGVPRMEHTQGVRRTIKGYQTQLLETSSVLSDVNLPHGCTRVTIINSLSRRTVITAQPALSADWLSIWKTVVNTDLNLVSAEELVGVAKAAGFFSDQVESVMNQPSKCDSTASKASRILAILSLGAEFPRTASLPKLKAACGCRVFYLQQHEDGEAETVDKLPQMLAPLHPVHLRFSNPRQFRQKLAEFVKAMSESERSGESMVPRALDQPVL